MVIPGAGRRHNPISWAECHSFRHHHNLTLILMFTFLCPVTGDILTCGWPRRPAPHTCLLPGINITQTNRSPPSPPTPVTVTLSDIQRRHCWYFVISSSVYTSTPARKHNWKIFQFPSWKYSMTKNIWRQKIFLQPVKNKVKTLLYLKNKL